MSVIIYGLYLGLGVASCTHSSDDLSSSSWSSSTHAGRRPALTLLTEPTLSHLLLSAVLLLSPRLKPSECEEYKSLVKTEVSLRLSGTKELFTVKLNNRIIDTMIEEDNFNTSLSTTS